MNREKLQNKDICETGVSLGNYTVDRSFGNKVPKEVIVYTISGKHDSLLNGNPILLDTDTEDAEDRAAAYAKAVDKAGQKKYYVKMSNEGKMFNPIGMMHEHHSKQIDRQRGRNVFEFTEVNLQAFNMYVRFLQSKNTAYLSHAEREGYLR